MRIGGSHVVELKMLLPGLINYTFISNLKFESGSTTEVILLITLLQFLIFLQSDSTFHRCRYNHDRRQECWLSVNVSITGRD